MRPRRGGSVLSLPAKVAVKFHGLFAGAAVDLLGLMNVFLPSAGGIGREVRTGEQSSSSVSPSWITTLNERARSRLIRSP